MAERSGRVAGEIELLVAGCAAGDRTAFRRLYDSQSRRLYGFALRMTRDPGMAADALHDALLQAWHRASRFDPAVGSAEGWLVGLVRYRAIDLIRKYGRERPGPEAEGDSPDPDPSPLDRMLATDDGERLHACLAELDEKHRRAVMLSFMDGLSHSELADRLGSPLGTVKSWVRRGLASLKACLQS